MSHLDGVEQVLLGGAELLRLAREVAQEHAHTVPLLVRDFKGGCDRTPEASIPLPAGSSMRLQTRP